MHVCTSLSLLFVLEFSSLQTSPTTDLAMIKTDRPRVSLSPSPTFCFFSFSPSLLHKRAFSLFPGLRMKPQIASISSCSPAPSSYLINPDLFCCLIVDISLCTNSPVSPGSTAHLQDFKHLSSIVIRIV